MLFFPHMLIYLPIYLKMPGGTVCILVNLKRFIYTIIQKFGLGKIF